MGGRVGSPEGRDGGGALSPRFPRWVGMKKHRHILLAALVGIGLSACGGDDVDTREELLSHDPRFHDLLGRYFPQGDWSPGCNSD